MKSMKIVIMILAVVLFSTVGAQAQTAPKIGYVDLSRLFDEYNKTKDYDAVLEKQHNTYQTEREKRLTKIKDAQGKVSLLKDAEKTKLEQEMEKDRTDLLQFDKDQQTDLKKQRDEKIREILTEIEKVVKDYAGKEKYSLILNDRVLIFGGPEMNVTEPILKTLNEGYKKPN